MRTSENINELATALSKAQAAFGPVVKTKEVKGAFSYKYADLATVLDAVREALAANGLSIIQGYGSNEGGRLQLTTRLQHASGQFIEEVLFFNADKPGAQGFGSAGSYYRRYSICAILGIAQEDDDGASADSSIKPSQDRAAVPVPAPKAPPPKPAATTNGSSPVADPIETTYDVVDNYGEVFSSTDPTVALRTLGDCLRMAPDMDFLTAIWNDNNKTRKQLSQILPAEYAALVDEARGLQAKLKAGG